ncbi:hypothetical protein Acsp06_10870 [Actinomycetospora sp. NBRC 106375]|uniref:hypothetical protein n=1 Tax=Actinomycetospora sp. NBRC 106375 TaxID=3032207 RepID=UPI0024A40F8A|nr:hypothetical protein [Actinomycetospora sp. NBRC 106375]GLZ44902.1 hypothetical protein Acsp06_10870 [Actinomycetospora sp. NBRC 106375]
MSAPNPPYGQQPPAGGPPYGPPPQYGPPPSGPPPQYGPPQSGPPPYGPPTGGGQQYGPPTGGQQYGPPTGGQQQFGQQRFGQQYGQQYGQQPGPPSGQQPFGQPPPFGQQRPSGPSSPGANALIPPGFGGVPLPVDIPPTVQRAFLLWIGIIAVNVVGTVLSTIGVGDVFSGVGIVFALLGGAIGVFLALHFRGRAQWARIVLTVLTGLAMLSSVFSFFGAFVLLAFMPVYGIVALATSAVVLAGGTLALINAWNAASTAWFGKLGF